MTNTQRIIKTKLIFENSQKSLFHLELNGVYWYFDQRIYKRNYCQEILTDKLEWAWGVLCRARSLTYPLSLIDSKKGLDRTVRQVIWWIRKEIWKCHRLSLDIILTSRNFMILCFVSALDILKDWSFLLFLFCIILNFFLMHPWFLRKISTPFH